MKIDDVRLIALGMGIKPGKLSKADLIRSIQLGEGNFDCFSSATQGECDQTGCRWREDCFLSTRTGEIS